MKQLYLFLSLWFISSWPGLVQASPGPARQLEFIQNKGQYPTPVLYAADVPGGRLFLEPTGLTYALTKGFTHPHSGQTHAVHGATAPEPTIDSSLQAHALRVEFVGGNSQAAVRSQEPTGEVRNYLRGNNPSQWAQQVPSFRQLHYTAIWPGINARFYENQQQQLEYDFELAPNADPRAIRLRYRGADALRLLPDGNLEIRTSVGILRELAPKAWQNTADGRRQPVACAYVVEGQQVHFRLGRYDHRRPLTIDPTVVFSTFTGSTADNWGFTATYDQQGNLYSGGIVFSLGYPASPGAYSLQFSGAIDIAIIKYSTSTQGPAARIWATYLGGNGADFPQSLVVNSQNELLVLATTGSTNFPTTSGSFDPTFNGGSAINPFSGYAPSNMPNGSDLTITRLSADGSQLASSTYLGGSSNEGVLPSIQSFNLVRNYGDQFRGDILVDAQDNVYIASNSSSPDFPTRNSFQPYIAGLNGVVCKLSPDLARMEWGSNLGGNQPDAAYSLQLDATGRLYVAGGTTSPNFPAPTGSLVPAQRGDADGFVVRISTAGSTLEKTALLGTSTYDQAYFVQLDQNGGVYVLGQTLGNYPTQGGRYEVAGGKQFIHKLNADLNTTEFATTFGSGRATIDISPTAFLVDQCERIYVSGWGGGGNLGYGNGSVSGMPTTPNATQRTTDGNDFYLMQLSEGARGLDYATFFGGSGQDHVDGGTSRFDPRGVVYQAVCGGCGGSDSWPIPPGAGYYSTSNGSSNCNNAAFKYNFETIDVVAGNNRDVCVASAPVALVGSPAGGVWSGPGVSGNVAGGYVFTPTLALLGAQTLTYTVTGVGPCGGVSTLRLNVVPAPTAAFTGSTQSNFCLNPGGAAPAVMLAASPAGGTFSGPGVTGSLFSPLLAGPGTHILTYNVNANGCLLQATRTVNVIQANAGRPFSACTGAAPVALAGIPAGGAWAGPGVSGNVASGFTFNATTALVGTQVLSYTVTSAEGCTSTSTVAVDVVLTSTFVPPTLPAYCSASSTPISLPNVALWSGRGIQGPSSSGFTFVPSVAGPGTHVLSYITGFGPCDASGSISVTVGAPVTVVAGADTILCPGTTRPFHLRATPAGGIWSGTNVSANGLFTPPVGFSGSVVLTYTILNECSSSGTRRVSVAPLPTISPVWTPAGCPENRLAPLTITFSGGTSTSSWDFGDGSAPVTGTTVTHTYTQAGKYQPRLSTSYNNSLCTETSTLASIEVLASAVPPNIITPNGDPKNEFFVVTMACPGQLQIFSRWGTKVFEAAQYQNNWNGAGVPDGVYYYLLRHFDGTSSKGWLTVQR